MKKKQALHEKETSFYNVLNNPVAKVALATSLLLSGNVMMSGASEQGIVQQLMGVVQADAATAEKHFTYTIANGEATITGYNTLGGKVIEIPATLGGVPTTAIKASAFASKGLTSVTIPDSVTSIGEYAFSNNQLTSVTIPDSVTSIGDSAFESNKLTSMTIPNSVTSIGNSAFAVNQLTSMTIPNSVTSIGDYTFRVNQLTSVTIPSTVTSIGKSAFSSNQLTSVTIPSSVTSIGDKAFDENKLTSLTIPSTVTSIGSNAFSNNLNLEDVTILNPQLKLDNGRNNFAIFYNTSKALVLYGYYGSTTQTYASNYSHMFVSLGAFIDTTAPTIKLVPNTTATTKGDITVTATITDVSTISAKKWAQGAHSVAYFASGGTALTSSFVATENGEYAVYAKDSYGNESVQTITIENIDTEQELIALATTAVVIAEGSQLQVDVDAARLLVNKLTNVTEKASLTTRLNTVQKAIDDTTALAAQIATATTSVSKADGSKVQADVDSAKVLVNALPIGTEKTNLTNRLNALQQVIDADKELQDAKDAVDNLPENPTQAELDAAKNKANQLSDGPEKEALLEQIQDAQDKLDAEKLAKDAQDAVNGLGEAPTQAELDAARDKVNQLPDGPEKDALLEVIQEVQDKLDESMEPTEPTEPTPEEVLADAEKAVDELGGNPTQAELDKAKDKVVELSDGPAKEALLDLIKEKQDQFNKDKAQDQVDDLGNNPTESEIDKAKEAVKLLPDGAEKDALLAEIEALEKALAEKTKAAKDAVSAIGNPPTLEELANAQEKVNLLPAGDIKNNLQKQINEKQKQLGEGLEQLAKAESAVSKAESFPTSYNVTIATKLVTALPEGDGKTSLEERLQAIQDVIAVEKAEAKVKQAESYERDPYLADAIALVDALADGTSKQALKDRLQAVLDKLQALKDAEDAANNADGAYDPSNPNKSIEDAINTIQDKEAKKYFTNWNKAVANAENYFSKTTVKNATQYLTDLPTAYALAASYENIIKELTERTQNLKAEEVAVDVFAPVEKAVANYEKYQSSYYLKKAKEAVEALLASSEKTAFEVRLGMDEGSQTPGSEPTEEEQQLATQLASVDKVIKNYEKFKTNFYQKKAVEALELLMDSEEKVAFQARLDAVTK